MTNHQFRVAIATSRKLDPYEAGRDIINSILQKLRNEPNVILLFATSHYKSPKEFREILNGIWGELSKNPKLIGGTVSGFINNHGCFAKGVTALGISYKKMNVGAGYGKNTKRNPKKAAQRCAKRVLSELKNNDFNKTKTKKLFINIISGPVIPKFPLIGRVNHVSSPTLGEIFSKMLPLSSFLGYGVGKESEIVDELSQYFQEFYKIGGSSMDDGKMLYSFEFYEDQVLKNSVVGLGIEGCFNLKLNGGIVTTATNIEFQITQTAYHDYIVKKINNKPAKKEFLNLLDVHEKVFGKLETFYYKTSDFFPLLFKENPEYTSGVGGFFGNNLLLGYKIRGKSVILQSATGESLLSKTNFLLKQFIEYFGNKKPKMVFSVASFAFLFILGSKIFELKNEIDAHLKDVPYLIVTPVNENIGFPHSPIINRVYSINLLGVHL